jgi:4-carboxymuconolactone decarboxylase
VKKNDDTPAAPLTAMRYKVLPERLPAIAPERMTDAQKKVAGDLAASRGSVRGPFVALIRSPELMDRLQKVGEYLRFQCVLDPRINRMAGMLTTRHWTNQYEWNGHLPFARKAGLSEEIIDAIAAGRRPAGMADDEAIVYDFTSELLANKGVSDPTYARALETFGEQGIIDLLGVIGYYAMNAMVMNVSRTPVPGGKPLSLAPLPGQIEAEGP